MTLGTLVDALAALGLASGMQRSAMVYALVSAAHVLGIALLVGPILLVDLRLMGALRSLDAAAVGILRRTAMAGTALAISTGVLLLSAKPQDYAANPVVWAKLGVVALALANALRFEWMWRRRGMAFFGQGGLAGPLSLLLWLSALLLGRWIAFV